MCLEVPKFSFCRAENDYKYKIIPYAILDSCYMSQCVRIRNCELFNWAVVAVEIRDDFCAIQNSCYENEDLWS